MLAEVEREWPWGLVLLGDPEDREDLPASLSSEGIARTASTVIAAIQHGVDGAATASVAVDFEPPGLLTAHRGELHLADGRLRLSDAANEQSQDVTVAPGLYGVRVLVDDRDQPSCVHFALEHLR